MDSGGVYRLNDSPNHGTPMDHYDIFANNCHSTIDHLAMAVDALAAPLSSAADLMTSAMLEERKVISCGDRADAVLAQLFTLNLLGWQQHERPALPALNLGAIAAAGDGAQSLFARQIQALGNAGDILFCISSDIASPSILEAVDAARERNMSVVALSNSNDERLFRLLGPQLRLAVSAGSPVRVLEVHTIVVQNLCELIDFNLFGSFSGQHE